MVRKFASQHKKREDNDDIDIFRPYRERPDYSGLSIFSLKKVKVKEDVLVGIGPHVYLDPNDYPLKYLEKGEVILGFEDKSRDGFCFEASFPDGYISGNVEINEAFNIVLFIPNHLVHLA